MNKTLIFLSALFLNSFFVQAQNGLNPFIDNGLYGFKDNKGEVILAPQYVDYKRLNDGYFAVCDKNYTYTWAVINPEAQFTIDFNYRSLDFIPRKTWLIAQKQNTFGVIDYKGNAILEFKYSLIFWSNNLFGVCLNGKHGIYGNEGQELVTPKYTSMQFNLTSNRIEVCENGICSFIDSLGNIFFSLKYVSNPGSSLLFTNGYAFIQDTHNNCFFIDSNGQKITDSLYLFDSKSYFENGRAVVKNKLGKYGVINTKGQTLIDFKYSHLGSFSDGFAHFGRKEGDDFNNAIVGYIDTLGNELGTPYVRFYNVEWPVGKAPEILPDSTHLLVIRNYPNKSEHATLERLLNHALKAFTSEPNQYPDLNKLPQICIGYGLMLSKGNYGEDFMSQDAWITFKKQTIYKIIGTEAFRKAAWDWVMPLYKQAFHQLNSFVKRVYKDMAIYLKNYINTYDKAATERYLFFHEDDFAHKNIHGELDKYRKLSAFVDRLILVHNIISVEDAKRWINLITNEVETWN